MRVRNFVFHTNDTFFSHIPYKSSSLNHVLTLAQRYNQTTQKSSTSPLCFIHMLIHTNIISVSIVYYGYSLLHKQLPFLSESDQDTYAHVVRKNICIVHVCICERYFHLFDSIPSPLFQSVLYRQTTVKHLSDVPVGQNYVYEHTMRLSSSSHVLFL